jgi:hypothetical protein
MMHSRVSGKTGYEIIEQGPAFWVEFNKETLVLVLKKENELRLSDKYQEKYSKRDDLDWLVAVTTELQREALRSVDEPLDTEVGLEGLQTARGKWKDDPEVQSIPLYIRFDRSHNGELKQGDPIPNCTLHNLQDSKEMSLFDFVHDKPLVLVAGSVT